MTRFELLEEIRETLQRDEDISLSMKLRDIEEWDSLALISRYLYMINYFILMSLIN